MSRFTGKVIGKRDQKGLFGHRRFFVKILYDRVGLPMEKNLWEYEVELGMYDNTLEGAIVSGELQQMAKSFKHGAGMQLLFWGHTAIG